MPPFTTSYGPLPKPSKKAEPEPDRYWFTIQRKDNIIRGISDATYQEAADYLMRQLKEHDQADGDFIVRNFTYGPK